MRQFNKKFDKAPPAVIPAVLEKSTDSQTALKEKQPVKKSNTESKKKNEVYAGFGKIKFDGLLQGWFTDGDHNSKGSFRIRRAELKLTGQLTPKVKWTVMIDPSKKLKVKNSIDTINNIDVLTDTTIDQKSRILQDAYISLGYLKNANIDIGQRKIPLSLEGLQSSSALGTVERSLFNSAGKIGGIRDIGIMAYGPLGKHFNYQIGVFNGTGELQNLTDTNEQKSVIGRFVVSPPFIKGLKIGASGALSNADSITNPRRDRADAKVLYVNGNFNFQSEVMGAVDGDIHRLGYYTHFGYKIRPKVEAIFRFDSYDPNRRGETNSSNATERDYVVGVNYFIKNEKNVKLQFNYVRKTFNHSFKSSRNLFLANLQTAW